MFCKDFDDAVASWVAQSGASTKVLVIRLKCGCCGGGFTILGQDRYGCATHRNKGTCANSATIRRQEIEARVLAGLKDRLMAPELVREFIRAFHEEVNRAAAELEQRIKSDALELQSLERKIASIVAAIEEGKYSRALSDRLAELERQRDLIRERSKSPRGLYGSTHG